ncbi:MAG: transcription elongation factor GreA [Chlamydiota bacterium]|nr:transcription elongation factor GreA [Chlamydiota bacterium]
MPNFMTRKTRDRLLERLRNLKSVESIKISKEIGVAREMGDLRENAEYDAAKNKQVLIVAEIRSLEAKLSETQLIEELPITAEIVSIGTVVELEDINGKNRETFTILGADDTDLENHCISYLSPLAKGIIGKASGEEVKVILPESTRDVRIISISKIPK